MIRLTGHELTLDQFAEVVHSRLGCVLDPEARKRVAACRRTVEEIVERGDPVYGVNTGFGNLASQHIPREKLRALQEKLLLSHAAGVGRPLADDVVRGMLLLRANTLSQGHSGVRPEVVDLLLAFLDRDLLPRVPSRGSVGASGDLAPLAHLALPLTGRGRVRYGGKEMEAAEALAAAGLEPVVLHSKEGLALINGTQAMTSLVALAALETRRLARIADLVGALTVDAFRGTDACFDPRLHDLRPHPGQRASAANLWRLLQGSKIRESHLSGDDAVQDPYSLRGMPQVHGAARDVLADVERRLAVEMNAVTDNPILFPEQGDVISGGNFHGQPIAFAADFLAIALSELGSIAERRVDKLTDATFSSQPPFLVEDAGLNSGFMIAQVTAAALTSENRQLATPASVDSISTSADQEDHVSMGMGAALRLCRVHRHVQRILAIELCCAAQGIDFLRPLESSRPLEELHADFRGRVARWDESHEMARDLDAAYEFLGGPIYRHLTGLE